MKYITVKLTEDQYKTLLFIVSDEVSKNAFSNQSDYVAFMSRLRTKLAKAKIS